MATQEEDFSFPTIIPTSPPRFLESPPLWRPSTSSPARPSCQNSQKEVTINLVSGVEDDQEQELDGAEEEKMDVLWEEYFNEDQRPNLYRGSGKDGEASPNSTVAGLGCVGPFRLSKGGGKRPSTVVFAKLLKKLLLQISLRNSNSLNKRAR